jgi:glucose-1-phosphate thymidylyltransferase
VRGELEITDVNLVYLNQKSLKVEVQKWLDMEKSDLLLEASHSVHR